MIFNDHSRLKDKHAFLSASSYHWLRYDEDKLADRFFTAMAAARGTELHEFANRAIKLGVKLKSTKQTLNQFVNDCIGFGMESEMILYYSENCFGTTDAIKYIPATKTKPARLLIFDLKTGVTKSSFDQLLIYAALFCLEYKFKPTEMDFELRIYQNDEIAVLEPEADDILHVMDRIVTSDRILQELKEEVL